MEERIIKIYKSPIGLCYQVFNDEFINLKEPFKLCSLCEKAYCPMCNDKYPVDCACEYHPCFLNDKCICTECDLKQRKERKEYLKQRMSDFKFKRLFKK
jgi:hypothetical protein